MRVESRRWFEASFALAGSLERWKKSGAIARLSLVLATASLAHAQSFQQKFELAASETRPSDATGWSVSVAGDVMVAGAPFANAAVPVFSGGSHRSGRLMSYFVGAAYVFRRSAGVWNEEQRLTASDPVEWAEFGTSVAISGDVVVVGAPGAIGGYGAGSGAAYVYRWNGSSWVQEQKLLPSDSGGPNDEYGFRVAISGDVIVVGAQTVPNGSSTGEVYIYRHAAGTWQEEARIKDPNPTGWYFGAWVSIDGDLVACGEPSPGEAHIFRHVNGQWSFEQTISDGSGLGFGESLSVLGDVIAVWEPLGNAFKGFVFVYRFNGTQWKQEQKISSSDGQPWDDFGRGLSLGKDLLIVGACNHSPSGSGMTGQAYVYSFNGTAWTEVQKLVSNDGMSYDLFGLSVSLSGNDLAIGAPGDDEAAPGGGSIYMFQK